MTPDPFSCSDPFSCFSLAKSVIIAEFVAAQQTG
jgi:hypothetical protein